MFICPRSHAHIHMPMFIWPRSHAHVHMPTFLVSSLNNALNVTFNLTNVFSYMQVIWISQYKSGLEETNHMSLTSACLLKDCEYCWKILFLNLMLQLPKLTLINDQLVAQCFYFIIRLLQSSTCFEQRRAHHQEVKLY